jgi:F0F1-type ATP synthase assembly protein I
MFNGVLTIIVKKQVFTQLMCGLVALIFFALADFSYNTIASSIIGTFIAVLPTIIYAKFAFAKGLVVLPKEALRLHKKAMVYKFIANILLFVIVLGLYKKCNYIALYCSFLAALCGNWFSLIRHK